MRRETNKVPGKSRDIIKRRYVPVQKPWGLGGDVMTGSAEAVGEARTDFMGDGLIRGSQRRNGTALPTGGGEHGCLAIVGYSPSLMG